MATDTGKSLTISVEQAAQRLGIGRTLAYELARSGDLPGVIKLGSRIVVSERVIENVGNGETKETS